MRSLSAWRTTLPGLAIIASAFGVGAEASAIIDVLSAESTTTLFGIVGGLLLGSDK